MRAVNVGARWRRVRSGSPRWAATAFRMPGARSWASRRPPPGRWASARPDRRCTIRELTLDRALRDWDGAAWPAASAEGTACLHSHLLRRPVAAQRYHQS